MNASHRPEQPSGRGLIALSLMLTTALASLDATIVSTAMPTVVGELGGLQLYSWVFTIYLLTSTTTVPIYGKLADLYGRKPVLLTGSTIFVLGSALCGLSPDMHGLILFRAIQGLGAGAIIPITSTIVGDLYTAAQRARIQGLLSSVWGASSFIGPAIGALFVSTIGWRWIFYVNLPVGLVAGTLLYLSFHERAVVRQHRIDYLGAALLIAGVMLLLLALAGEAAVGLPPGLLLVGALVSLAAFIWVERRAPEPLLPLTIFRQRVITVAALGGFFLGGLIIAIPAYVPLLIQGGLGGTPAEAGAVVALQSIGWPIGSTLSGRSFVRFGFRPTTLAGGACVLLGTLLLALGAAGAGPRALLMGGVWLSGFGMGLASTSLIVGSQEVVPWNLRGVATSSGQFFRSIGGTIWVAVLGAIFAASLAARLAQDSSAALAGLSASTVLDPATRAALPPEVYGQLAAAIVASLGPVFLFQVGLAVAALGCLWFFPTGQLTRPLEERRPHARPAAASTETSRREPQR